MKTAGTTRLRWGESSLSFWGKAGEWSDGTMPFVASHSKSAQIKRVCKNAKKLPPSRGCAHGAKHCGIEGKKWSRCSALAEIAAWQKDCSRKEK